MNLRDLRELRAQAERDGWRSPALIALGRACDRLGVPLAPLVPPWAWARFAILSDGVEGAMQRITIAALEIEHTTQNVIPWLRVDAFIEEHGWSDKRLWICPGNDLAALTGCKNHTEIPLPDGGDHQAALRAWVRDQPRPAWTVAALAMAWAWTAARPSRLASSKHRHSAGTVLDLARLWPQVSEHRIDETLYSDTGVLYNQSHGT